MTNKTNKTHKTTKTNKTIKTYTNNTNKTINKTNKENILSYFIKDIKDPSERSNYKQKNGSIIIEILYKDKILYKLNYGGFIPNTIYNYKNNNMKCYYFNKIANYKIETSKSRKYKKLFFNKNNNIYYDLIGYNYIYYTFEFAKYLSKTKIYYKFDDKITFSIEIKYYNGYKYLLKFNINFKYDHIHVYILNKYELHYYNKYFNLFIN